MPNCPFQTLLRPTPETVADDCSKKLLVAHDIVDVLGGKWKMEVILTLLQYEKRRFKELQKELPGISAKVLSTVLKDLEAHHILTRQTIDPASIQTEYALSDYGRSMKEALAEFIKLGMLHRKEVIGKG